MTTPRRLAGISGCTILRNGVKLRYPFEQSIASYAPLCDEVLVCWDPASEDDTRHLVETIARWHPNVRLVESRWDMSNRMEGTELARQTQIAFDQCRHEWTFYVQADEAIHEDYFELLRNYSRDPSLLGVAFRRLSFLGTPDREIPAHRAEGMVRMFRTGLGQSVGDAMFVRVTGPGTIVNSPATLFNYSRLGSEEEIRIRSDNLNAFYHDDAYLAGLDPNRNKHWDTLPFTGTHPAPIAQAYRDRPHLIHNREAPSMPETRTSLIISVDDIRPEAGRGLELESGPVAMLRDLHAEFGCKFTLFMPTNYYGRADLRDHHAWFRSLLDLDIFEVACHGHHHWNLAQGRGDMEYSTDTPDEVRGSLLRSIATFQALGYSPKGVKPPGWGYNPEALVEFASAFEYLADHVVGTDWQPSSIPDFRRLPYTRCIHEPLDDLASLHEPLIVLHSHLSGEGGKHQNGWDLENFTNVRRFLAKLSSHRGPSVSFLTASESLDRSTPLGSPSRA